MPGATPGDSDPSVGVGSNGTVYFGYVGADGKPGVAVSRDQGKTWTDRQTVGTEFGIQNAVFPTMVAGDDDRASFAYLGTPTGGNYQDIANFHGEWHLYVDTTYDGGKTWVTSDATPNDPVQRRLDLHRRHHLWRRPQPARLHRRDHRRPRPGRGRLRRRLHRRVRHRSAAPGP